MEEKNLPVMRITVDLAHVWDESNHIPVFWAQHICLSVTEWFRIVNRTRNVLFT